MRGELRKNEDMRTEESNEKRGFERNEKEESI